MAFYRRKYLCLCEGQQEQMYLDHVARLIKDHPKKVVTFNAIVESPRQLGKRYENYDAAALFDYDHNDLEFQHNVSTCDDLNRKHKSSRQDNGRCIFHAYSSVNFDLWLILHKEDFHRCVMRNDAYIPEVRRIFGLKSTDDIKNKEVMGRILNQITLEDVRTAIRRADIIRDRKLESDQMKIGNSIVYPNPDFSIHEFLKTVLTASGDL